MSQVSLKNVFKIYAKGAAPAVSDVNLEIRDKEFMVLVGPSGCGKSTTLRMVAGLEEVSSGEIRIGDRVVNDVPPKDRDIAMVFQNYALYPHMTVYDNMAFALKLRHVDRAEIDRRVREAAATLGISDYLDRKPKALSGGQRQRVAVGRAIVRKPAVFLFDEPLSNLDAKMRVQMRAEISMLHHRLDTTMIYVTHDQVEAMTMGDRICVMKDGVIQQVDTPLAIYDNPANLFVAGFIGTPPTNFFRGRLEMRGQKLFFANERLSLPLRDDWRDEVADRVGGDIVLGVRPEDIGSPRAEQAADAPTLTATAVVIEPMGAETYLHLSLDGGAHTFLAKVSPRLPVRVGQQATLAVDLGNAHLFDPQTEKRIV